MKFVGKQEEAGAKVGVKHVNGERRQKWYFEYSPSGKNANC